MFVSSCRLLATALLALLVNCTAAAQASAAQGKLQLLHTSSGIRFGLLGEKGSTPAPTLFAFSGTMQQALETVVGSRDINPNGGHILAEQGFLFIVMDLPCHGGDRKAGQPREGLDCWASQLDRGEDFLPRFISNLSSILDFLIQQGYTDPGKVGAWGLSRGGFIALHFAAGDARVKWIAAFAPVTDLIVLHEFKNTQAAKKPALVTVAHKLTSQALWLWIGNDDLRVGTDSAVAFTRRVVETASAQGKQANVELHIAPTEAGANLNGHTIRPSAYEEAAAWMLTQMKKAK